ncbi:MAG: tetratricopeptide repeat protein [Flavobacteriaceae bacterium]|jgi:signal transduction histidine kinase|nr:tetratricopeptide repeat protein [Flavobacteriaceae bacterium]
MKTKTIFLILLFLGVCGFAQKTGQARIDSLLTELKKTTKEDSVKAKLLYDIGLDFYRISSLDEAEHYADTSLKLSQKIKYNWGIAASCTLLGNVEINRGNLDSAVHFYKLVLNALKESKNTTGMTSTLANLGAIETSRNNDAQALSYFLQALDFAEKHKQNDLLSPIYNNISNIYFSQKNLPKAEEYTKRALSFAREIGNQNDEGYPLMMLGNISLEKKDTLVAKKYYGQALSIFEKYDDKMMKAEAFVDLGNVEKNIEKRIQYKLSAKKIWDSIGSNTNNYASNLHDLAKDYFQIAKDIKAGKIHPNLQIPNINNPLDQAENYLLEGIDICDEQGYLNVKRYCLSTLSEIQEFKGDYKNALKNFKEGKKLEDSLFSQENKNKIAALESQKEIDLRDSQIKINQLALSNAKRTRIALIAGSGLLLIIGGLLFYQSRNRKKNNNILLKLNKELDEANKVKTTFFGILSHDLRSPIANLINFLHLQKSAPEVLDKEKSERRQTQLTASAENLLETMEAVLLWSKSQMQRFEPQKKQISAEHLFSSLQKQSRLSDETENSGINISFHNPQNISIFTDEDYLKTIMYNLTANALKALANTENPMVEWSAEKTADHILLKIRDNGPGLQKEQLNALYDENAAIGTRFGLGLHLIRDLAKAIDCKIEFQPAENGGSEFELRFLQK